MAINYIGSSLRIEVKLNPNQTYEIASDTEVSNFKIYRKDDYSVSATASWNPLNPSSNKLFWIQGSPVSENDQPNKMSVIFNPSNLVLKNNFTEEKIFVIIKEV